MTLNISNNKNNSQDNINKFSSLQTNTANSPIINMVNYSNKPNVVVGDTVIYTLNITNNGTVQTENLIINDNLDINTSYIDNSINGTVPFTGNPTTEIIVNNSIAPGDSVTIYFSVSIDNIPIEGVIINQAVVSFQYVSDITTETIVNDTANSNILILTSGISKENAINSMLFSVALEEISLSHILNAEGEKIQYALGTLLDENGNLISKDYTSTISDILDVNYSVNEVLKNIIRNGIVLGLKVNDIKNM